MEIADCQNLATANPVLLFVESSYGLFEIVDWAAQAQLIVAVGPAKARRLRALAIRTVFDLETAVRDPAWHPRLAAILGEDADGLGRYRSCPRSRRSAPIFTCSACGRSGTRSSSS